MPRVVEHTVQAELRDRAKLQTMLNRACLNRWRPPDRNAEIIGLYKMLIQRLSEDDLGALQARDERSGELETAAKRTERRAARRKGPAKAPARVTNGAGKTNGKRRRAA